MPAVPMSTMFYNSATAVAQAIAMAGVGIIASRTGILDSNSRKVLSTISMKVTIPCLLFTAIMTCPQGGAHQDPALCPDLLSVFASAWPMLLLPLLWVSVGLGAGAVAAKISGAPKEIAPTVTAACAFGNSTGLPIVLLTAIAQSGVLVLPTPVPAAMQLRNFLLLLSVYQITYPVIQWTLGGWLLSTQPSNDDVALQAIDGVEAQADACVPPAKPRLDRAKQIVQAIFVPPVIAVFAGAFFGVFPPLRQVFVDTTDYNNDRPLEWLFNAIQNIGMAAVPVNMLVLGGSLASIPNFSTVHWPSTLSVVFVKMILVPAICFAMIAGLKFSGWSEMLVANHNMAHDFIVVACLVAATPTANNLTVMAEVSGGAASKHALAAMIFVMYCLAPFLLTAWIVAFVALGGITHQIA